MSSRTKKAKPGGKVKETAETPRVAKPEVVKPLGSVPGATVSARRGSVMIERAGKGFSLGELSDGGLSLRLAKRWGVPLDPRRRSVLQGNVAALKKWFVQPKKAVEAPPKSPRAGPRRRAARKKED